MVDKSEGGDGLTLNEETKLKLESVEKMSNELKASIYSIVNNSPRVLISLKKIYIYIFHNILYAEKN